MDISERPSREVKAYHYDNCKRLQAIDELFFEAFRTISRERLGLENSELTNFNAFFTQVLNNFLRKFNKYGRDYYLFVCAGFEPINMVRLPDETTEIKDNKEVVSLLVDSVGRQEVIEFLKQELNQKKLLILKSLDEKLRSLKKVFDEKGSQLSQLIQNGKKISDELHAAYNSARLSYYDALESSKDEVEPIFEHYEKVIADLEGMDKSSYAILEGEALKEKSQGGLFQGKNTEEESVKVGPVADIFRKNP